LVEKDGTFALLMLGKGAAFGVFGYGSPSCPDCNHSEVLSSCILVLILQEFTFELVPNHPKAKIVFDTMMTPHCNFELKLS
jgi:hypothetical protein